MIAARLARTPGRRPRRTVVNIHLPQWGTGPRLRVAKPSSRPAGALLPWIHRRVRKPRQLTKPGRAPTFDVVAAGSIRQFASSSCPGPAASFFSCPLRRGASPSAGRRPAADRTRRRPPPELMKRRVRLQTSRTLTSGRHASSINSSSKAAWTKGRAHRAKCPSASI